MSPFRNCGPFTAGIVFRMLPRHFIGVLLVLGAAIATTPLFAQQSPQPDRTQAYVDKYSEQLSPLKEAKFAYSGYCTTSTPTKGLLAKNEYAGDFRVSVARKSFHCTCATQLVEVTGKPDFAPEDLGVDERLVTPDTCLRVSIAAKNPALPSVVNACVETTTHRRGDEWSSELSRNPLGMLLGYAPCNCKNKSLQDITRSASCHVLENQLFDSRRLSGFSVETDDLEVRALFDLLDRYGLKQVEVSRPAVKAETDGVYKIIRASLTVLEVRYADSLPSFVRLKISWEQNGGAMKGSYFLPVGARYGGVGLDDSFSINVEPQTWDFYYEIDKIVYQEQPQNSWFMLDHAIPDGATVKVEGDRYNVYEWRHGKVNALPSGAVIK